MLSPLPFGPCCVNADGAVFPNGLDAAVCSRGWAKDTAEAPFCVGCPKGFFDGAPKGFEGLAEGGGCPKGLLPAKGLFDDDRSVGAAPKGVAMDGWCPKGVAPGAAANGLGLAIRGTEDAGRERRAISG